MEKRKIVSIIAAAAFITAPLTSTIAQADDASANATPAAKHCFGLNKCKGHGKCKSAANSCNGQNKCKGQGWMKMSEKKCTKKGGTWTDTPPDANSSSSTTTTPST